MLHFYFSGMFSFPLLLTFFFVFPLFPIFFYLPNPLLPLPPSLPSAPRPLPHKAQIFSLFKCFRAVPKQHSLDKLPVSDYAPRSVSHSFCPSRKPHGCYGLSFILLFPISFALSLAALAIGLCVDLLVWPIALLFNMCCGCLQPYSWRSQERKRIFGQLRGGNTPVNLVTNSSFLTYYISLRGQTVGLEKNFNLCSLHMFRLLCCTVTYRHEEVSLFPCCDCCLPPDDVQVETDSDEEDQSYV